MAKRLGFVFIVTAHMVFNVTSRADVSGFLGTNITIEFTFNSGVDFSQRDNFIIHKQQPSPKKIKDFSPGTNGSDFSVNRQNKSVFWFKRELKMNDSGSYVASLINGRGPAIKSEEVRLNVLEPNTSSTVPPMQTKAPENHPSAGASYITILLLITPVVVCLVALALLIWLLVGQKDAPPGQNPPPKETVQESAKVSESSLVYSVLDFPMRSSAVLEVHPEDTEYADVGYLPEMRPV